MLNLVVSPQVSWRHPTQSLHQKKHKCESELDQKINAAIKENRKLSERLSAFDPKTITDTVINAVQGNYPSSKPAGFASKQFKPSQFYHKPREPQLIPGTDGLLKPETDCNYCKDLGHLKYNCPKLKEKEARMAGHQNYNKSNKKASRLYAELCEPMLKCFILVSRNEADC